MKKRKILCEFINEWCWVFFFFLGGGKQNSKAFTLSLEDCKFICHSRYVPGSQRNKMGRAIWKGGMVYFILANCGHFFELMYVEELKKICYTTL